MRILKMLSCFLICILCTVFLCNVSVAAGNVPFGDVGEYGSWITPENMDKFKSETTTDLEKFQNGFQKNASNLQSSKFVPIEAKISLAFMQALSSIDKILQSSLVPFTILFLFIMYAFWVALEAYKMTHTSSDYKTVLYDIFKKGFIIAIWVAVLNYGPAKIFAMIINPVLSLGNYISTFILDAVAGTYNIDIPDTCATIQDYVNQNAVVTISNGEKANLLVEPDVAANIICLPARMSVYFYHATAAAWKWMISGFTNSITAIIMGAICVVIFIKCIFKYAFMTLGIVANLFLTLLMLPFTALAEAMPSTSEKSYVGQIFSGFLSIFKTRKLSEVILTFINATIYFISLSIVIAICAALLTHIVSLKSGYEYSTGRAMVTILCGCLVLYLANKADALAKQIGGSIDNSFGEKLQSDTKTLWNDTKNVAGKIYKDWLKKK